MTRLGRIRPIFLGFCGLLALSTPTSPSLAGDLGPLRPPAVPLVAHDPYFSIWSPSDRLTDSWPCHWTGKTQGMQSMVRIDGKAYRLMGIKPQDVPAMEQKSLSVFPTRTIYTFADTAVEVVLMFTTPTLPDDLDVLARPVTYISWSLRSLDGKPHQAAIYFDASSEIVVNEPKQKVTGQREAIDGLAVLKMGSTDQPVLAKRGDDLRIDWGYAYVAAEKQQGLGCTLLGADEARALFADGKPLPDQDDARLPRAVQEGWPSMAFAFDVGEVGDKAVSKWLMIAYDDLFSIQYFTAKLRPYWRRSGAEAADLLKAAVKDYPALVERCCKFDDAMMADLEKAGGPKYARLCALAYREAFAGNKIAADANGQPLVFPKENFSNGCIATVDVLYPMAPVFLLTNASLVKGSLVPILDYAQSPRWKFPFAPHDLGTYPHATGQVYGGGERTEKNQMPVEESGNMLILVAAIAEMDGNAEFAAKYWPALSKWAEYLKSKGLDPENQLCTDDFAGHLAHNVNLSGKAICGLGAYAKLCDMLGKKEDAAAYRKTAEEFAAKWIELGAEGDHYRLAFDKPGTWSQKYNLVWDRLLGMKLFPESVFEKEGAFYLTKQNRFGLPLDNRKAYTKLDWIVWTATMLRNRQQFDALIAPVYDFLNETPSRVPITDWYQTTDGKMVGFRARPVIGAVFIKLLDDLPTWKKWVALGGKTQGNWAPLPVPQ